ncbi:phosphoribosyltransferase-like protein [Blyttiomyces helicus]|uniref:Phosphoribosyltransferase-like protein n=1 Tax=Blyttiomyces helicus TaxID=388810 RepID=A0A4P9W2P9_9FUNG|nr:phosphoribosyltransferase-like protein [Blyttiomyces helicus]|eukprot:RKO84346.1 phosphoribosyltransferase-like protein [Blyttiomyces helicus]
MYGYSSTRALVRNRVEAGRMLAKDLAHMPIHPVIVLALPRGGVPVAFEIAKTLNAPLDLMIVRKLGIPGHEETAFGAISINGVTVLDEETISALRIPSASVEKVVAKEAAIGAIKAHTPAQIIVAAPVGAPDSVADIARLVDIVVCPFKPEPFMAVGCWPPRPLWQFLRLELPTQAMTRGTHPGHEEDGAQFLPVHDSAARRLIMRWTNQNGGIKCTSPASLPSPNPDWCQKFGTFELRNVRNVGKSNNIHN